MLKRYTLLPMRHLWVREETKFEKWLEVELAVLKARVDLGELDRDIYDAIRIHSMIAVSRIDELEAIYDHDMIAFVTSVQESLEDAGVGYAKDYLHKKVTSYDIEDPAFILMLREATALILEELGKLEAALVRKAHEHKWTLMVARTHGQFAEPSTFGHLLLVFANEIRRSIRRLRYVREEELGEGKLSGAVGTYAGLSPELEIAALGNLGLKPARAETQILQRDRHAALMAAIVITGASMERICRTFWEMMRSDVCELEEPRKIKQRGSSAMPQKKNPILCERVMGLARILRGCLGAAVENIATPEWRDVSQSSVERHIFPDATSIIHYMAAKLTNLVTNLVVFPDRMRENLDSSAWAAQRVRYALMEKGLPYDEAYRYMQGVAFTAQREQKHIRQVLMETAPNGPFTKTGADILGQECFDECFCAFSYITPGIEYIFGQEVALG